MIERALKYQKILWNNVRCLDIKSCFNDDHRI